MKPKTESEPAATARVTTPTFNVAAAAIVAQGDLVALEFTGKTADGKVFESTATGKPVIVAAGKGQVVRGLDEALVGARIGEKHSVKIPKEKAFGARNPELVRLVSLQKFKEQGIEPFPGLAVEIDGARCRVQSVSGGRVRVDFNHDLAGVDVEYAFEVKKIFRDAKEKITALADELLAPFEARTELSGETVRVTVPAKARKDADFIARKLRFISSAFQFVPEVKRVVFEEEYAA
ncbi:MAG: peptidylprolyl isomerase [Candidatus Norongarragalinales archaeon]